MSGRNFDFRSATEFVLVESIYLDGLGETLDSNGRLEIVENCGDDRFLDKVESLLGVSREIREIHLNSDRFESRFDSDEFADVFDVAKRFIKRLFGLLELALYFHDFTVNAVVLEFHQILHSVGVRSVVFLEESRAIGDVNVRVHLVHVE